MKKKTSFKSDLIGRTALFLLVLGVFVLQSSFADLSATSSSSASVSTEVNATPAVAGQELAVAEASFHF